MLSGVFLECLNERRLSFIQNNLFLKTSTHRNYSSVANTPNITVSILSAAELQDNPVKSFAQALRRLPQKKKLPLFTIMWRLCG